MMNKRTLIAAMALVAFAGIALAQTVTNAPPVGGLGDLPHTKAEFWTLGIAAVTPLIVRGINKLAPNIPTVLLPVSTPLIGVGLGLVANKLGNANLGWLDTAQAGALAVFVRETWNQAITKRMEAASTGAPPPPPPPPAPGT